MLTTALENAFQLMNLDETEILEAETVGNLTAIVRDHLAFAAAKEIANA